MVGTELLLGESASDEASSSCSLSVSEADWNDQHSDSSTAEEAYLSADDAVSIHDVMSEYSWHDCHELEGEEEQAIVSDTGHGVFTSHLWGDEVASIEGLSLSEVLLMYSNNLPSQGHKAGNDFSKLTFLTEYLVNREDVFYEDACEVFGGQSGVLRLAVRRKLKGKRNFDLTCNVDLTDPDEVESLFRYLSSQRVFCVVMGPPCTAFGPWATFNRRRW